jgi:tetratricopeptide (TPR) repeat protein
LRSLLHVISFVHLDREVHRNPLLAIAANFGDNKMKHMRHISICIFITINLTLYGQDRSNEIPMYGHIQKSEEIKKIDNEFIEYCLKEYKDLPEASEAHVRFAWGYFYKNDLSTAIKRFNQAWLLDSTNCDCYFGFAAYMKLKGDSIQSDNYFKMGKAHDSENIGLKKYYLSLAFLYEDKGLINKSIELHKLILILDSAYTPSIKQLGYLYMNIKDSTNSIKYFNKAIKLNPKDSLSYLNRGWLYYENKLYNNAISDYSRAIEIQPTYISAYANRAFAYVAIGEYGKAIEDYNKCLNLVPEKDYGEFYYYIGETMIKNNDKIGGCNCIKKSIDYIDKFGNGDKKKLKKYYKENCK